MQAVIKRLMTDVPFGVLLSGGLDSSLVASITARHLAGTKAAKQWGTQLHSFCVGLVVNCRISKVFFFFFFLLFISKQYDLRVLNKSSFIEQGSPDLKAAREVAGYLGTVHHEFHFTVQVCYR